MSKKKKKIKRTKMKMRKKYIVRKLWEKVYDSICVYVCVLLKNKKEIIQCKINSTVERTMKKVFSYNSFREKSARFYFISFILFFLYLFYFVFFFVFYSCERGLRERKKKKRNKSAGAEGRDNLKRVRCAAEEEKKKIIKAKDV